jgi:cell division transport system ATP-binding protein
VIKVIDVDKIYGDHVYALQHISVDIAEGEFVFVVGPSGSGKSTFLKLLTKEEDPTAGDIYVAGKRLASLPRWRIPYLRRHVGCVFQDFKVLPTRLSMRTWLSLCK